MVPVRDSVRWSRLTEAFGARGCPLLRNCPLHRIEWRSKYLHAFKRFIDEEDAPTMVEYALLVVAIALLVYGGARFFGLGLSTIFSRMGSALSGATVTLTGS